MDVGAILTQLKSKFDTKALQDLVDKIPVANLIPIVIDLAGYVPQAYNSLTPEQKAAIVAAVLKLIAQYGGSGAGKASF